MYIYAALLSFIKSLKIKCKNSSWGETFSFQNILLCFNKAQQTPLIIIIYIPEHLLARDLQHVSIVVAKSSARNVPNYQEQDKN